MNNSISLWFLKEVNAWIHINRFGDSRGMRQRLAPFLFDFWKRSTLESISIGLEISNGSTLKLLSIYLIVLEQVNAWIHTDELRDSRGMRQRLAPFLFDFWRKVNGLIAFLPGISFRIAIKKSTVDFIHWIY